VQHSAIIVETHSVIRGEITEMQVRQRIESLKPIELVLPVYLLRDSRRGEVDAAAAKEREDKKREK
jgi:hypothetical protein